MEVIVELFYDGKPSRDVSVQVSDRLQGVRLLDAIERKVEKEYKTDDWTRWNLKDIKRGS